MRPISSSIVRSGHLLSRRLVQNHKVASTTDSVVRFLSIHPSPWKHYEMAPRDPIVGLNESYKLDYHPKKVIVGVGAYRDDQGKPYILPCVREAEDKIYKQHLDMEYSGIVSVKNWSGFLVMFVLLLKFTLNSNGFLFDFEIKDGDQAFVEEAIKFAYGKDSAAVKDGRIQGVQTLSGTGGLRVMGDLLARNGHKEIYIPNPSWGNHKAIFMVCRHRTPFLRSAIFYDRGLTFLLFSRPLSYALMILQNSGLDVKEYAYYDKETSSLGFDAMIGDLENIPSGTCVLLHACAHNPTG